MWQNFISSAILETDFTWTESLKNKINPSSSDSKSRLTKTFLKPSSNRRTETQTTRKKGRDRKKLKVWDEDVESDFTARFLDERWSCKHSSIYHRFPDSRRPLCLIKDRSCQKHWSTFYWPDESIHRKTIDAAAVTDA